jgi:hypothetical protein
MVNGGSVLQTSHRQSAVELTTMEEEYVALSNASGKLIARRKFLEKMNIPVTLITTIKPFSKFGENSSNYRNVKVHRYTLSRCWKLYSTMQD